MKIFPKNKTAIIFISGSAGELDWILPILDFLLKKSFKIEIFFLTIHALRSVEENNICNDFITQDNQSIQVHKCGSYFFEKIERIGYLSYRIFLKLKLNKLPVIKQIYSIYEALLKYLFFRFVPLNRFDFEQERYLFISEFPSLRRPRDVWIKQKFKQSIFFYCPHSPHIYTNDLDQNYDQSDSLDLSQKSFLLLGHPGDFSAINDGKELAMNDLEKVFIGHPKYSDGWLGDLQKSAKEFRSNYNSREKTNVLVLSRGFGSYFDEDSHINLVNTTLDVIDTLLPNYNLLIKKHPREKSSHWDNIIEDYSSVDILNDHILQLATRVDFVISYWSSGAMDCHALGVPVIELYDPNKHSKQQFFDGDHYTTIYRKLGLVYAANDKKELVKVVSGLLGRNFKMQTEKPHSFYKNLIDRSNLWEEKIEEILSSHSLINR